MKHIPMVIFHGKYGDDFYRIDTVENRKLTFEYVLKQRLDEGYYDGEEADAEAALVNGTAEQFMKLHKDGEHENFSFDMCLDMADIIATREK